MIKELLIHEILLFSFLISTVSFGYPQRNDSQSNSAVNECPDSPDIIFFNASIITMDTLKPMAEAIAIKADKIITVGSNTEILALLEQGCGTKIIDLKGLTILPGFNDSHEHFFSWREHICSVNHQTTYPSLEEIMQILSANGWTSISELNFGRPDYIPEHLKNSLDLDAEEKLSVRVNGYWGTYDDISLIDILADSMRYPRQEFSTRIHVPGVKIYVDNPFGNYDILSQEQVNQLVQKAHQAGWQVAAHAVNESAVEKILSAYENVLGGESNENYRHRIEHAVKVSDDQLNRMKQKGIIASFQLLGPADWPDQSDFGTRFTISNPEWVLRWKDFVQAGAEGLKITGSTDSPFNDSPCDYSPFRGIYQTITRKGYVYRTLANWELNQRLTVLECLKLLTIDGAYATFEENKKGSLTPGKWADLIVVSKNPLQITTPEDLLNIKTYLTMVGGRIEYCDNTVISDLCTASESFVVDSGIVSASKYLNDNTPDLAFDNDTETSWVSGDFPHQWIQIDMMSEIKLDHMELVVAQYPEGRTIHQIWAKADSAGSPYQLLNQIDDSTYSGQILNFTSPSNVTVYRYFKIITVQSPSWVAWKEIRIFKRNITDVNENKNFNPSVFDLFQNYPNPFNPSTTIRYAIPLLGGDERGGLVTMKVYDVLGNEVATLVNEVKPAGAYEINFYSKNLSSGVYFYLLQAGSFVKTKKMILLR